MIHSQDVYSCFFTHLFSAIKIGHIDVVLQFMLGPKDPFDEFLSLAVAEWALPPEMIWILPTSLEILLSLSMSLYLYSHRLFRL